MLSLSQKESILRKKGVTIPPFPVRRIPRGLHFDEHHRFHPQDEQDIELELNLAVARWQAEIDLLYELHIRRSPENPAETLKNDATSGTDPEQPP